MPPSDSDDGVLVDTGFASYEASHVPDPFLGQKLFKASRRKTRTKALFSGIGSEFGFVESPPRPYSRRGGSTAPLENAVLVKDCVFYRSQ